MLLVATACVALMSEFLVGAVEATAKSLGMTEVFVGVILVAIIGNAAEHSTAMLMAMKNKMDIAINIAVGSSIQIALFVAPVLVFLSYVIGPQPMDLIFTSSRSWRSRSRSLIMALISQDGESNWMEGVQLLAVYAILGIAFFFLPACRTTETEARESSMPRSESSDDGVTSLPVGRKLSDAARGSLASLPRSAKRKPPPLPRTSTPPARNWRAELGDPDGRAGISGTSA